MTARQLKYNTYLKSDEWSALRKQKFGIVGRKCQNCLKSNPIHVHHIRYRQLIDCTPDDLIVFCEDCHNILHKMIKFKKLPLEGHGLDYACALINEFKASPDYEIRKNRIRLKRRAFHQRKSTEINPNRLAKREKKEIRTALNKLFSSGSTMEGLHTFIMIVQSVADRRKTNISHLIMNYGSNSEHLTNLITQS